VATVDTLREMPAAKRSTATRSLAHLRAVAVIVGTSAILLAAAWGSWRWQNEPSAPCGAEPGSDGTPAADQAHHDWEQCRDSQEADRAVPAALAVFAIMVTASGVAVAYLLHPGRRWARGDVP
jgi:hypothetical protein